MAIVNPYLSIITSNVMDYILQSKETECWNKKIIPNYTVYKKLISVFRTHTSRSEVDGKRYSMQMEAKRKAGVAIPPNKTHFKPKTVARDNEENNIIIKGQFIKRI